MFTLNPTLTVDLRRDPVGCHAGITGDCDGQRWRVSPQLLRKIIDV